MQKMWVRERPERGRQERGKTGEREDRREEGPWVGEVVECLG